MEKYKGSFYKGGLEKASPLFHQSCWKPSFFSSLLLPQSHLQNAHVFLCQGGVRFDTFAVRYRNANGEIQQHLIRECKLSVNLILWIKNPQNQAAVLC